MESSQHTQIRYKHSFLTEVIARIDFLGAVETLQDAPPRVLANIVTKSFPILEPNKIVAQQLQISPQGAIEKGETTQQNEWKFFGTKRDKFLAVSSQSLLVSYEKYESFEDLLAGLLPAVDWIATEYPDLQARRLGLRYVNNIELKGPNPLSWAKYINKSMLCSLDVMGPKETIARAFHNLELNLGHYRLRFQYGIHNPDYPAPVKQRIFVIDLDAFSETPVAISSVPKSLTNFHSAIQAAFERNVTDALRTYMNA